MLSLRGFFRTGSEAVARILRRRIHALLLLFSRSKLSEVCKDQPQFFH